MIRTLLAHRSLVATAASGTLVAALIAGVAITSDGFDAEEYHLGDGAVWVVNAGQQAIGRANLELLALDTAVESPGGDIALVQDASTVLMVDEADARMDIVDPATAVIEKSVPLPAAASEVRLAGDNAVVHSGATGATWISPVAGLTDFDPLVDPTFMLGAEMSVSPAGELFAYSPDAGAVYRVDASAEDPVAVTAQADFGGASDVAVSSVAGRWVLLDPGSRRMSVEGREVDLSALIGPGESLAVQSASDDGDRVLVAHDAGLVSVPLGGGDPVEIAGGRSGTPVAPVVVAGCSYAAWSDGTAWRACGDETGSDVVLASSGSDATPSGLAFAVNGDGVLLNDPAAGTSWAVQRTGQSIDNWGDLLDADRDEQQTDENDPDSDPDPETSQLPPVAVDDAFGARPGRSTLLPVLLNDYDPNGDVLVVADTGPIDEAVGRIEVVDDGQSIQLVLAADASGEVVFEYGVTDGRGGRAEGRVTVAVRSDGENGAPTQVRRTSTAVARGGTADTDVLGDWVDPDGDPMYLRAASVAEPDTVSYRPEGGVVFQEGGGAGSTRVVSLTVSDGRADGAGSLSVTVGAEGSVPITAEPFVVTAYAGEEVTIDPLQHVEGGTGPLRLLGVPPKQGATIAANLDAGTFRFGSDEVRTHLVDYVVGDATRSVTGVVRVEVRAAPADDLLPVTTPKTVFLKSLTSQTLDVTATDIDPAGGVLLVTGIEGLPADAGVTAEVLDQALVRVSLVAPLGSGSVSFSYRVTNGSAEAVGSITVIEVPTPEVLQPPTARDDAVTARVGDVIDIPVLDNDDQPDGAEITLDPVLVRAPGEDDGLMFANGKVVRYLAPEKTGNFTAVYQIVGSDGQVDQAQITVSVREPVAETNEPPSPTTLVARVVAGETVRVTVPLAGTDPDGDSVQLLGQETNPAKGTVTEVGTDFVDYTASSTAVGTDSFTYTVVDALGATASGTVRVGISERSAAAGVPLAVSDEVTARPGTVVTVPVLANDHDPAGSRLSLVSVESAGTDLRATLSGDTVQLTAPQQSGRYALSYTIQNETGGSSSAFVTVVVDPAAARTPPVASDTVLTLSDIRDRQSVDVDVLENVFFADGDVDSLGLSVLPGYDTATVTGRRHLEIRVTDRRQVIPFAVAHPEDPSIVSYAFVWVPGSADALPQLDRAAPALSVKSGTRLLIDLEDYVVVTTGRRVRLVDTASVQATHANGDSLVASETTLAFTSVTGYAGRASISFTVSDGEVGQEGTREATLVLPIEVIADQAVAPVFSGGAIDFEPGQRKTLDLRALTAYPAPGNADELVYTLLSRDPDGFDVAVEGGSISVTALDGTPVGTGASVTIGVRGPRIAGEPGVIRFQVVPSSRPLAVAADDAVSVVRGSTARIDVLANDEATNPFPGTPLRVVSIRGAGSSDLPPGLRVTPSADSSTLTVTVAGDAPAVDATLQYGILDATEDPSRQVFGTVRVSVQDRPDTPVAPTAVGGPLEEGVIALRITPPEANNSAVTGYTITSTSNGGYRHDCGTALICSLDDLQPGLDYAFSVVATNAVGPSAPSPASAPLGVDFVPQAPASVGADPLRTDTGAAALRVTWSAVPDPARGSPVTGYTVQLAGAGTTWTTTTGASATSLDTSAGGSLTAGVDYVATVWATNGADVAEGDWRRTSSAAVRPIGPPTEVAGGVSASVTGTAGAVRVDWGASDPNGGSSVVYSVGRFADGEALPDSCTATGAQPGVSAGSGGAVAPGWVDPAVVDAVSYRYVVYAQNEFYCTLSASGAVRSLTAPASPVATTTVEQRQGQTDARAASVTAVTGAPASTFQVRLAGTGTWTPVATGDWLTSRTGPSAFGATAYGAPLAVEYRACRADAAEVCGPASPAQSVLPVDARGSVVSCALGGRIEVGPPANLGSPTYVYRYAFNPGLGEGGWTEFALDAVVPQPLEGQATQVRVQVTVILGSGESFTDIGFAEGTCT